MLKDPANLAYTLNAEQRAAVERFAAGVRALLGDALERVVLYGSRARGDADEGSDIDLLVLTRHPLDPAVRSRLTALAVDLEVETPAYLPISLVVLDRERFADLRARERRFALDVDREGIAL
jgi:predicted nucleotidyltransferase